MKSKRAPSVFGKVQRLRRPPSDDEHRVKALLKRLQLIVPEAPKQGRVPQVEMIQHVIDYICDLEQQVVQQLGDKKLKMKRLSPADSESVVCQRVEHKDPSSQLNRQSHVINPAGVPQYRISNQMPVSSVISSDPASLSSNEVQTFLASSEDDSVSR